jgi:hypothetical protein
MGNHGMQVLHENVDGGGGLGKLSTFSPLNPFVLAVELPVD